MYKMLNYDSPSVSRVMFTNCPFCYCAVNEEMMIHHAQWHLDQQPVDEAVDNYVDNSGAGEPEDTRIHIEL